MHSCLFRFNAAFTFAISGLALICIAASITDLWHPSSPQVDVQVLKYDGLHLQYDGLRRKHKKNEGNDVAKLKLNITADLSSLFSWNTKQLFVFVEADYVTPEYSLNQISLWDKIIISKKDAKFQHYDYNKYRFVDQGNNLRGLEFNLTMYWNIMPITGGMLTNHKVFTGFRLPNEYF